MLGSLGQGLVIGCHAFSQGRGYIAWVTSYGREHLQAAISSMAPGSYKSALWWICRDGSGGPKIAVEYLAQVLGLKYVMSLECPWIFFDDRRLLSAWIKRQGRVILLECVAGRTAGAKRRIGTARSDSFSSFTSGKLSSPVL